MARKRSGITVPSVGASVRHPLWPELGLGRVETVGKFTPWNASVVGGRVRWSCGQVSKHNLSILCEVAGD